MKIVYNSWYGRYSDNPKAVHRRLVRRGDAHEHVWLAEKPSLRAASCCRVEVVNGG